MTAPRRVAIAGLLAGACGIALLWAGGVEFPVAVPPGMVILLTGAVLAGFVHRPWTAFLAAILGLFVTVGFLASPTGLDNLTGDEGTTVALGQAIQVLGVLTALASGILAFRLERSIPGPR